MHYMEYMESSQLASFNPGSCDDLIDALYGPGANQEQHTQADMLRQQCYRACFTEHDARKLHCSSSLLAAKQLGGSYPHSKYQVAAT